MISSADSMKLGILQIDSDLAIFQKTAVGILNYRTSLLCSGLSGFSLSSICWLILGVISSMQYIWKLITQPRHQQWNFITQPRHQQYYSYYTATTSAVLFRLESPTYSASYLN